MEMTKKYLKELCKENGLYTTPEINDKLFLHCKGFKAIENLEEYVGLKALWLESNAISKIEGLDKQTSLKTLFLHENLIEKIENLENLTELDSLNLSKNCLHKIENLSNLTKLTSLNVSYNHLRSREDVEEVLKLPLLQTLDLQHNKLNDPDIVSLVSAIPDLRVLYLLGNPVVKDIKHYRKVIVSKCQQLKYLDDRPVFDDERRRCNVWAKCLEETGSFEAAQEAERQEILLIRQEKDAADERNYKAFQALMEQGLAERNKNKNTSAADKENCEINIFTGETIIEVPSATPQEKAKANNEPVQTLSLPQRQQKASISNEPPSKEVVKDNVVQGNKEAEDSTKWTSYDIIEEDDVVLEITNEEEATSQQLSQPTVPTTTINANIDLLALD